MTVRLAELNPMLAARSCTDCEKWMFDDKQGEFGPLKRLGDGQPMARPAGVPTPCHQCPKIPSSFTGRERVRKNAIDPTPRSVAAYWHYRKCRAVQRFPEDELFEANATIIDHELRACAEAREMEQVGVLVLGLFGSMASRMGS